MSLFSLGKKDVGARLKQRAWSSEAERDQWIQDLLGPNGSRDQQEVAELLFVPDGEVKKAALLRFKQLGNAASIDAFFKVARQQPVNVVAAMARTLLKALPPEAYDRAVKYMDHSDEAMRRLGEVFALSGPLNRQVLDRAQQWLTSEDAGRALQTIETLSRAELDAAQLRKFAGTATEHPDERVRGRGWQLLAQDKDPANLARFVQALPKESYHNQKLLGDALLGFVNVAGADVSGALFPLLSDPSTSIRTVAVNLLKRLDDLDGIVRRFTKQARTMAPVERERAFETLRDLGPKLIPSLLELMDDPDRELRNLAITIGSTLGEDPRMVKPLLRALRDQDWWIRATAMETLGQIGTPEVIPALVSMTQDPDLMWTAFGALAATAKVRRKANDTQGQNQALTPLIQLIRQGSDPKHTPTDESADARIEALQILRQDPPDRLADFLRDVAQKDLDPRVKAESKALLASLARDPKANQDPKAQAQVDANLRPLERMLVEARKRAASDLHVAAGQPTRVRKNGKLTPLSPNPLPPDQAARVIRELLTDDQAAQVATRGQVSFCHMIQGQGRFRANVFADHHGLNAVFRVIPEELPTIASVGMPSHFSQVQHWHQGLLLVCGASGSGKTTTLAALINLLNETRESHIITVEDPIEYVHPSRRSLVNQRELGLHTRSYARALRGALRQDPDVIVLGELSDHETVAMALEASETGHLVIGTLNCTTAVSAVDRFINSFSQDEQNQVRLALSESLKAIVAQTLLPTVEGGMTAAFEILMGTDTVGSLIRENKILLLEGAIQTGRKLGMQTYDDALISLARAGKVSPDEAARRARSQATIDELLGADARA